MKTSNVKSQVRFSAVILAGGQGERMSGLDKGLVLFQGKPMIEWILALLESQFEHIIISCNRNHDRYREYGFQLVGDEISGFEGPLAGIQSAMHKTEDSFTHLLVLPCDTPLFDVALVTKLVNCAKENTDSICLYKCAERLQFLHTVIPLKYGANLDTWLEQGERAVYKWYKQFPMVELDAVGHENSFLNVNRKQDIP